MLATTAVPIGNSVSRAKRFDSCPSPQDVSWRLHGAILSERDSQAARRDGFNIHKYCWDIHPVVSLTFKRAAERWEEGAGITDQSGRMTCRTYECRTSTEPPRQLEKCTPSAKEERAGTKSITVHKVLPEDSPAVIDMGRPGAFVVEKPSKSIPALRVHTHYVATIVCHAKKFKRFPAAPETLFVYTPIPGVLKELHCALLQRLSPIRSQN